jgi:D-hexose-6-phosphate mutarotase
MQALQRANAVRLARAELKRRIALGEITAADVILGNPWEAESMTVSDLLTSQRRWGHTRCRRLLQCIPMSENKTIGSMTERQRRALAQELRRGADDLQQQVTELRPVLAGVAG